MSKKAILARENITGHSFMLETHTIDEESEDSQESPSSKKASLKDTNSSNFKSLPKYSDPLGQIDEEPFEDGNFASEKPRVSKNKTSPIGKEKKDPVKKQYDT